MSQQFPGFQSSNQSSVKTMNAAQFEQVVEAVIEGKYSWACVLILRFAGYNPAHYIPYRTYKRLIKEHRQAQLSRQSPQEADCTEGRCSLVQPLDQK